MNLRSPLRRTGLRLSIAAVLALAPAAAFAIFQNGGFENGYTGWTLGGGTNPGLVGAAPFTGASVQITPGAAGPADVVTGQVTDALAPTITLPRVGQRTARLNDSAGGARVTTLRQVDTVTAADIDPADGKPHIRFAFAPVMEDPSHSASEQPYFYVALKNLADGSVLFEQFAYSGQPGVNFKPGSGSWKYLDFQDVDVTLPASAVGAQVELTVVAADCSLGGHGGYVYIDGFGSAAIPPPNTGGSGQGNSLPVPATSVPTLLLLVGLLTAFAWKTSRRLG